MNFLHPKDIYHSRILPKEDYNCYHITSNNPQGSYFTVKGTGDVTKKPIVKIDYCKKINNKVSRPVTYYCAQSYPDAETTSPLYYIRKELKESTGKKCYDKCEGGVCFDEYHGNPPGFCFNPNTRKCTSTDLKYCCPPGAANYKKIDGLNSHQQPSSQSDCQNNFFYPTNKPSKSSKYLAAKKDPTFNNWQVCQRGCCCIEKTAFSEDYDVKISDNFNCIGDNKRFFSPDEYQNCVPDICTGSTTTIAEDENTIQEGNGCCLNPLNNIFFGADNVDSVACCPEDDDKIQLYSTDSSDSKKPKNQRNCINGGFFEKDKKCKDFDQLDEGVCCILKTDKVGGELKLTQVRKKRAQCEGNDGQTFFKGSPKDNFCEMRQLLPDGLNQPSQGTQNMDITKLNHGEICDSKNPCDNPLSCVSNALEGQPSRCCRDDQCLFGFNCHDQNIQIRTVQRNGKEVILNYISELKEGEVMTSRICSSNSKWQFTSKNVNYLGEENNMSIEDCESQDGKCRKQGFLWYRTWISGNKQFKCNKNETVIGKCESKKIFKKRCCVPI
jgi:hypothetical protein